MRTNSLSARWVYRLAALAAFGAGACGAEPVDNRPLPDRLGEITADLSIGSTGSDVRALHDYLNRFGYFPNAELAKQYPRWRPAVSTAPADPNVFDGQTEAAVRRLQANLGLEPTGTVNGALRTLLRAPRCGVPDNVVAFDSSEKWAPDAKISAGSAFAQNWVLSGTPPAGVSPDNATAAAEKAALTWMGDSSLTMANANDFGWLIPIIFENFDNNALIPGSDKNLLGDTFGYSSNPFQAAQGIHINTKFAFSTDFTPNTNDLQSLLLHEMGHALGIGHDAWQQSVMFPSVTNGLRTLEVRDKVAVSAFWDMYWTLPGSAIDIATGADGSLWIVGTDSRVAKWNGTGWDRDSTRAATRIAVDPSGFPYVVAPDNSIWRATTTSPSAGSWEQLPGAAFDIGIGGAPSDVLRPDIWVVKTDRRVYKFDFATNNWGAGVNATANRIAVSPSGKPWIVTTSNTVSSWSTNNPSTGSWQSAATTPGDDIGVGSIALAPSGVPGAVPGAIRGMDGVAFATDRGSLLVWDEQPSSGIGASVVPASAAWRVAGFNRWNQTEFGDPNALPTGAKAVSVDKNGKPWVVGANGAIYTSVR